MTREWKPGDVAIIENYGGIRAVRAAKECAVQGHHYATGDHWHYLVNIAGASWDSNGDHRDARPLVVIDPEDAAQVERLAAIHAALPLDPAATDADDMQAALREFANPTPPRPEEPTGLGAVVEDDKGCQWVRVWSRHISGRVWTQGLEVDGRGVARHYDEINAVRVLSEGIS